MVRVTELNPAPCTVAVEIFSVTRLSMKVLMVSSQACSRECPVRETCRSDSAPHPATVSLGGTDLRRRAFT